jgi:nucleotide-binding universal stress UspA family protein
MLKIERILCPVDFSEFSPKSYEYACSLASHYKSRLLLLHIIEPLAITYPYFTYPEALDQIYSDMEVNAREHLAKLIQEHPINGARPETIVKNGPVAYSILTLAEEGAADLIVMGTHGRKGLEHAAMGSVTEKVMRSAHCPVLAVRKPAHDFVHPEKGQDPVRLRKILFCTDFSDTAQHSLTYAFYLALEYHSELTLLHVLENLPESEDLEKETASVMRRLREPIPNTAGEFSEINPIVRVGKPYEQIVQLALEMQTDLIVMGVRGRNALNLALFGSTTQRVIQFGSCPVLVVQVGTSGPQL